MRSSLAATERIELNAKFFTRKQGLFRVSNSFLRAVPFFESCWEITLWLILVFKLVLTWASVSKSAWLMVMSELVCCYCGAFTLISMSLCINTWFRHLYIASYRERFIDVRYVLINFYPLLLVCPVDFQKLKYLALRSRTAYFLPSISLRAVKPTLNLEF